MFDTILIEFVTAGVLSFALTTVLSRCIIPILVARKAGQPIRKEGPKSHFSKQGTPTMGGIAFIMAIAIVRTGMTIWYAVSARQTELIPMALTMALAVMNGMVGFVDDYRKLIKKDNEGLKAGQKFSLQVLAAIVYVFLLKLLGHIDTVLHIPFTQIEVELGIVYYVFAVILIVGIVNSVNLTDGLDGLASTVTLVVAVFFAAIALTYLVPSLSLISACLIGAMCGFLIYNHHPAKVFMGDTGSLFLGGAVVGCAFIINEPMIILAAGGIYVFEAVSVILQVFWFKTFHKRIFKCAPVHHHFEQCGWSEVKVVCVFSCVTALLCVLSWFGL
jgi:phospho-N-acetylmuramoyl-pentapeptide-transferase